MTFINEQYFDYDIINKKDDLKLLFENISKLIRKFQTTEVCFVFNSENEDFKTYFNKEHEILLSQIIKMKSDKENSIIDFELRGELIWNVFISVSMNNEKLFDILNLARLFNYCLIIGVSNDYDSELVFLEYKKRILFKSKITFTRYEKLLCFGLFIDPEHNRVDLKYKKI